jgi:hypothetical protein
MIGSEDSVLVPLKTSHLPLVYEVLRVTQRTDNTTCCYILFSSADSTCIKVSFPCTRWLTPMAQDTESLHGP